MLHMVFRFYSNLMCECRIEQFSNPLGLISAGSPMDIFTPFLTPTKKILMSHANYHPEKPHLSDKSRRGTLQDQVILC